MFFLSQLIAMSVVFFSFVLLFSLQVISALVPQVPLCNWDGCPMVSRIGLGTLHLGDKLNGISDPTKVKDWIQNGVNNGITLFDTADVSISTKKFNSFTFLPKPVGLSSKGWKCRRCCKVIRPSP